MTSTFLARLVAMVLRHSFPDVDFFLHSTWRRESETSLMLHSLPKLSLRVLFYREIGFIFTSQWWQKIIFSARCWVSKNLGLQ